MRRIYHDPRLMSERKFIDYDGPTGLFVATKGGIKPLHEPAALVAMADSAMLSSLGDSDLAREYGKHLALRDQPVHAH